MSVSFSTRCRLAVCGELAKRREKFFGASVSIPSVTCVNTHWRPCRADSARHGENLWRLARGIDDRSVVPDHDAKSISHETTFAQDIDDESVLRTWMLDLTEQVGRRLRRYQLRARTVQIKVRFNNFHTITRARSLPQATDITSELWGWQATSCVPAGPAIRDR